MSKILARTTSTTTPKSFGALSRCTQAIATEISDYSKWSSENGSKTMKKLLAVKSIDEAIEVQSEYAKATYEGYTAEVRKLVITGPSGK